MATTLSTRVTGPVDADNTARVHATPATISTDGFSTYSRRPWTFRAATFKARALAASLLAAPSAGGTQTTRVTGI
jgi:hypothetical protein